MLSIVFIHPDLGIGGAERAIIDAALALKTRGHNVCLVTGHHDVNHCFDETNDGSLNVIAVGDWIPRSLFGYCYALLAYLKIIYVACYLVFFSGINYDLVICDQISACIPFLKLKRKNKVLFYCHFPDKLLTDKKSFLKKMYRIPLDYFEEYTTGMADKILVNSNFTARVFQETFKSLKNLKTEVLYPVPDFPISHQVTEESELLFRYSNFSRITFLSINRYERKKNISLAIEALNCLREMLNGNLDNIQLVVAGGYDERLSENRDHYQELISLTKKLNLKEYVSFYRSVTSEQKQNLFQSAICLLYTPDLEHFGIVPVEAMHYKLPVIAVNSGGPTETILHGETGFLCSSDEKEFAKAMFNFIKDPSLKERLGQKGYDRALKLFSYQTYSEKLDSIVQTLINNSQHKEILE